MDAMADLVEAGRIRSVGVSNFNAEQMRRAHAALAKRGLPLAVNQVQYNLLHRQRVESELAPLCAQHGIGLTTWSPLAFGILTGKYNDGVPEGSRASMESMAWIRDRITPEVIEKTRALGVVAEGLGMTTAQLAIAWLLRQPAVTCVLVGAKNAGQIAGQLGAVGVTFRDDELARIDAILADTPEG